MLRPIRKFKKRKNRFSVNLQNLLYTIFCESTVLQPIPTSPDNIARYQCHLISSFGSAIQN